MLRIKRIFVRIIMLVSLIVSGAAMISARDFVVVIDPGHGGKDHGALGPTVHEKTVNLAVALKLGQLIEKNMKDVKVVYTRSTDKFISLQKRADIANEAGGDLFISIHTNSVAEKSKNRAYVNGTSVYVLGAKSEANLAVAQRENSVIMLEDDYKTTYAGFDPTSPESYIAFELIQNQHMDHSVLAAKHIQNELVSGAGRKDNGVKQAMFWVLVKTGMPSVLVELDFICNPKVDRYLGSKAGQTQLAEAIFNGFKSYKTAYDRELAQLGLNDSKKTEKKKNRSNTAVRAEVTEVGGKSTDSSLSATQSTKPSAGEVIYKVQFLTSPSRLKSSDSRLRGIGEVDSYREGGVYKYTVGATTSLSEANDILRGVKKKFSDAFVIKTVNGKRVK